MEKLPMYSEPWVGQDGKYYRSVRYWVGAGWSASFLQKRDELYNWNGV